MSDEMRKACEAWAKANLTPAEYSGRTNAWDNREAAFAAGAAWQRERDAQLCEREKEEYWESSQKCDASGNTTGGGMDASAASACALLAAAIRKGTQTATRSAECS